MHECADSCDAPLAKQLGNGKAGVGERAGGSRGAHRVIGRASVDMPRASVGITLSARRMFSIVGGEKIGLRRASSGVMTRL